ncbi:hypothetical protein JZ751_012721 [Albula glossodonta]|nr:hypothetical protein JZ751_012721 [Albula glossodonta]
MEKGMLGEIYNIGTTFELAVTQLARELIKMMKNLSLDVDVDNWLEFVEDRPCQDLGYPLVSHKLHGLGWRPRLTGTRRILTIGWKLKRLSNAASHWLRVNIVTGFGKLHRPTLVSYTFSFVF